jgi:polyhydroxyalkanoate synthase
VTPSEPSFGEARARTLQRVLTTCYPVAQTPKELIWTLNKARLYRYTPRGGAADRRYAVPLLLVFALINRPYILDLRPGYSFVEYMLATGFDVYLIDWGSPGLEDRELALDDYVLEYLPRAIRKMQAASGSDQVSLLGWCLGALLTVLYAALRPDDGLRNLILLTAPVDFSDKRSGGFVSWLAEDGFDVERVLQTFGNVPGELIDYGAKALRPAESYVGTYQQLFGRLDDPEAVESWHAMNTWVNDVIPVTGASFRQLVQGLYRENALMNGSLYMRGKRVDLGRVRASVLNVIAERDHIVPPPQSATVAEKLGSRDKQELRIAAGHIGIMAGRAARQSTWPHIEAWLALRSRQT